MPDRTAAASHSPPAHSVPALSLAALGVVFGDIGTSPLYALKTALDVAGKNPQPEEIGIVPLDVEIGGAALLALSR
jgi:KUP system potassium uptake protein